MKKLFIIALLFLSAGVVNAQETANINVTANVLTTLQLNVLNQLNFGNTMAGQTKTIANNDAAAAVVQVTGATGTGIDISFTLPTNLTDGGNNLPISFGTTSAGHNTTNNTAGITDFDPNSGVTNVTTDGTTGELFVYLGGEIAPTSTQSTGTYTGTVTINVSYN